MKYSGTGIIAPRSPVRRDGGNRTAADAGRPTGGGAAPGGLPPVRARHARRPGNGEVTVESDTYQITVGPGLTITAPRTTSRDIKRHKASNYQPG